MLGAAGEEITAVPQGVSLVLIMFELCSSLF